MNGEVREVDESGTVTLKDGTTHFVSAKVKVTLNGKAAKSTDLVDGDKVVLRGNPLSSIDATRA